MTTLNTALNYNFASSEAVRLASAQAGAEEVVAQQLRQSANDQFKVGSIITARYQYKVGPDGGLVPIETQVTHEAAKDDPFARRGGRQQRQQYTFNDLVRPRAELSPSDEMALFAGEDAVTGEVAAVAPSAAEAFDGEGQPVEAEIIPPKSAEVATAFSKFTSQVQFAVASLYARNNDIVYNVSPIAQLAA